MLKLARNVTRCLPSDLKLVVFPHGDILLPLVLEIVRSAEASRFVEACAFDEIYAWNDIATMAAVK